METMTYADYEALLNGPRSQYFRGRWEYYKVAIEIVQRINPASVLELGPGSHTIVKRCSISPGCDVMMKPEDDAWGRPLNPIGRTYLHDATQKPWPIPDQQYDLFIALQVYGVPWEHLANKQSRGLSRSDAHLQSRYFEFPVSLGCAPGQRQLPRAPFDR